MARDRPWRMIQRWHDLCFLHWPLAAGDVRPLVPAGLDLDLFEGRAWLGVVPFRMSGIRLRGLPPLPGAHAFPELNVRTYVTDGVNPGVWFLSLDAASRLAVAVARRFFHLPYHHARMSCREEDGWVRYASRRGGASFEGRYRAAGPVHLAAPGTLEHWLTERYCLYARAPDGRVYRGDIAHDPWPLQGAEAAIVTNTMSPLPLPATPPLAHFARFLDVRVWMLEEIGRPRR